MIDRETLKKHRDSAADQARAYQNAALRAEGAVVALDLLLKEEDNTEDETEEDS